MLTKLFVFGLPGSGKSTVARAIVEHIRNSYRHWTAYRICDYHFLYSMAQQDKVEKDFYPVKHDGFYVSNPTKYNDALKHLEKTVNQYYTKSNRLLVVEFARSDYMEALKVFGEGFFQNSSFLYLHVDANTCIERIGQRVLHPRSTRDDHYVSEYTFERYTGKDAIEYPYQIQSHLNRIYLRNNSRFTIINSGESLPHTLMQVTSFADQVIREGAAFWPWQVQEMQEAEKGNTDSRLRALSLILP